MLRTLPRGTLLGAAVTTVLAIGLLQVPGQATPETARAAEPAYRNSHLSVEQRVDDLLSRMTLARRSARWPRPNAPMSTRTPR